MLEWLVCFVFGCLVPAPAAEPIPPDVSRIISVVGPRSMAHACPVAPDLALTAGHVAQEDRVIGPAVPKSYRAESAVWAGYLDAAMASSYEDAGFLRVDKDSAAFPSWYEFQLAPPLPGERLWWIGFDWSKRSRAFERRLFSGRVLRIVAGNIILDTSTPGGSSGSCVLNSAGRVVGTISWNKPLDDDSGVGVAVGMWPPWFTGIRKEGQP